MNLDFGIKNIESLILQSIKHYFGSKFRIAYYIINHLEIAGKLDKDALWKIVFSRKCNILENQSNVGDILKSKWEVC